MDARNHQIEELRTAAKSLRAAVHKARSEAAGWQTKADQARELADRNEETARVWELLADALDGGQLDDIVVPLGTGDDGRPKNPRIHALQGRLMADLPNLDAWNIHCGELTAMLHKAHGGDRRTILGIADRYGIDYTEDDRGRQVYVAAEGEIDDIPVKIWCLLPADDVQPVDDGGALNDHGRDYAEEAAQRAEAEREGLEELATEQAAKDAEAAADAMSASERFEHDQADEFAQDAADAERWAEENAANQYDDEHYNVDDEDGDL